MSKFRTRIRDVGRAPGGMGFTAIARKERPRYVLVVAEAASASEAEGAVRDGADAIVFTGAASDLARAGLDGNVPVGVRIEDATRGEVAAAAKAGADFFLFDDGQTHAGALTVPEMGAVLLLGSDQDEQRLRAVSAISLDAVLVEADADTITVREQIELRRVASLTGAPLLLRALGTPDATMLEAWRDAGAPAVLVQASDVPGVLEAARQVPPPRREDERRLPTLGGLTMAAHDHDHDDEDDD